MRAVKLLLTWSLFFSPGTATPAQAVGWTDIAAYFSDVLVPGAHKAIAQGTEFATEQWAEFSKFARLDRYQRFQKHLPTCRQTLAAVGTVAVLSVASVGYYNVPYWDGTWKNQGSEELPSYMPEIGKSFVVQERSSTFSIPSELSLWVHDGSYGYGKVIYRNDRVEYVHGDQLVASSDTISPSSRPYSKDHPIITRVYDSSGNLIGSIEEFNDETTPGSYGVVFAVKNAAGEKVGETSNFEEDAVGRRADAWQLDLQRGGERAVHIGRRGWILNRYVLENEKDGQDPRLLIVLAGYKYAVDSARAK